MKFKFLSLAVAIASTASAGTVTLDAVHSGFYAQDGFAVAGNYATGWFFSDSSEIRSVFVFDLSTVAGTVTSATLRLAARATSSGFLSPDPTETITLFDVSTPIATLLSLGGSTAAFNDLGAGTAYGSLTVPNPGTQSQPFINYDIPLNAAGLAAIQSRLGPNQIAFGGALTSLTRGAAVEAMFNGTNGTLTRQLIITTSDASPVPEPASSLLLATGLLGAALLRRRR